MGRLYIIRHGQTVWNKENRLQGWKDAPLTEKGIKQAEALKERLEEEKLSKVYSSPLGRTLRTAEIATENKDLDIKKDERIKEINMGKWEGTRSKMIKKRFPGIYHDFWKNPHEYEPISGESFYDVKRRTESFLKEIVSNDDGNILVVSHGCASKLMMSYFEGRPLRDLWKPPELKEGCLNIIDFSDEESKIIKFGDTSFRED